jgi:hypothetical protein
VDPVLAPAVEVGPADRLRLLAFRLTLPLAQAEPVAFTLELGRHDDGREHHAELDGDSILTAGIFAAGILAAGILTAGILADGSDGPCPDARGNRHLDAVAPSITRVPVPRHPMRRELPCPAVHPGTC